MEQNKTVVIIQARMTSSRLPGKILKPLASKPVIQHVIERCQRIPGIDAVCVAAPDGEDQLPLKEFIDGLKDVLFFQGSEHNVMQRTLDAAVFAGADTLVRVTSDCPFIDPEVSGALLSAYQSLNVSYARLVMDKGFPLGFDTEVFKTDILKQAALAEPDDYEKEHVTPYIWRRPEQFSCIMLDHVPDLRNWRLVVDEEKDYAFASAVYDELYTRKPEFGFEDLKTLFAEKPSLLAINSEVKQTPYLMS